MRGDAAFRDADSLNTISAAYFSANGPEKASSSSARETVA